MATKVRIDFIKDKEFINFYKDGSFIYHRNVNGIDCGYGFINSNKNTNIGVLVPNLSDLFGVIPYKEYIRIIDKKGFTIKLKNEEELNNKIIILNPYAKPSIGFKIENNKN
jgi:hypothetical protein